MPGVRLPAEFLRVDFEAPCVVARGDGKIENFILFRLVGMTPLAMAEVRAPVGDFARSQNSNRVHRLFGDIAASPPAETPLFHFGARSPHQ